MTRRILTDMTDESGWSRWLVAGLTLGASLVIAGAVALLWHPAPPGTWPGRLLAALIVTIPVVAGTLRLLAWRQRADQRHASGLEARALLFLAGGIITVVAGGGQATLLAQTLPLPVLAALVLTGLLLAVLLLAIASTDLRCLLALPQDEAATPGEASATDAMIESTAAADLLDDVAIRPTAVTAPPPDRARTTPTAEPALGSPAPPLALDQAPPPADALLVARLGLTTLRSDPATWLAALRGRPEVLVLLALSIALATQLVIVPRGLVVPVLALFLLAALLGLAGLGMRPLGPATPVPRMVEAAAISVVVALAVFFRVNQLTSAPEGVWFDEAMNGLVAQRMLNDPSYRPVYVPAPTHHTALYLYLQAASIYLFGPTVLALRLVATVAGIATVVGIYFLARMLFGMPVALAAGVILASQRWHVNISRNAQIHVILAPAFAVGTFYFALRGLRTGSRTDLTLAGACLGLGLYAYASFYWVPLMLAVVALIMFARGPARFVRQNWRGVAIMIAVTLVILAPLFKYIYDDPDAFTQRMATTSVLRNRTVVQAWPDLVENVRRHVIMLHYRGDPNGRHNLPGAPMFDPLSAALFVLGLAYSLRSVRRPEYALLVSWCVLGLLPGILSLDFEAPQAFRSIVVTPGLALLSALGAGWLASRAWEARRHAWGLVAGLPLLAVLSGTVTANYDMYFNRQLVDFGSWAAYSTAETLVARDILRLPPDTRAYLSENFVGQPTLRFLAPQLKEHVAFDPVAHLPLRGTQTTAIFIDPQVNRSLDVIRRLYPHATVTEHRGPTGGPNIMTTVVVTSEQISALHGVQATYYAGAGATVSGQPALRRKEETIDTTAGAAPPLPRPYTVDWKGTVSVPAYGRYQFRLEGTADGVLTIDETEVLRSGQAAAALVLAKGNHALHVRASFAGQDSVRLLWQTPDQRTWQPIGRDFLFVEPVTNNGLLGSYYANANWQGPPAFTRIDPSLGIRFHLLPLPRPWTVEWTGKISVPSDGRYRFATQSISYSWLSINGQLVVDNASGHDRLVEGTVQLAAGFHDIRVRYIDQSNFSHIAVYWAPPGRERELIPSERLFPPQGRYPEEVAPLPAVAGQPGSQPAATPPAQPASPTFQPLGARKIAVLIGPGGVQPTALADARSIAVDPQGSIYVVEAGAKRITRLSPEGQILSRWGGTGDGNGQFSEPVAVAIDPAGRVHVLDAERANVQVFSTDGQFLTRYGAELGAYRPRGLSVGDDGLLYLADTGRNRVLRLTPDGVLRDMIPPDYAQRPPILDQPTAAVGAAGTIYVAEPVESRLARLAPNGRVVAPPWPLAGTDTLRSARLAVGPHGELVIADVGGRRVLIVCGGDKPLLAWQPAPAEVERLLGAALGADGTLYVIDAAGRLLAVALERGCSAA